MDLEQFRNELKHDIGRIHERIDESDKSLGRKIDNASQSIADLKIDVAVLKKDAHQPESCAGLRRHENDHDKSDKTSLSAWSKISLILGIVMTLIGVAAIIYK